MVCSPKLCGMLKILSLEVSIVSDITSMFVVKFFVHLDLIENPSFRDGN